MITVLQRSLGVAYNFKFSQGDYDATDSRNLFLHGLLSGFGGTCVTMPILYSAIGRRLGWPLKLVFAKKHVFCRWDEGPIGTFNIEATSPGFVSHPDRYYHRLPMPLNPIEIASGWYLRSLTPREELAFFIANRGNCRLDHLQPMQAADEYLEAMHLAPSHVAYRNCWQASLVVHQALRTMRKSRDGVKFQLPRARSNAERMTYKHAVTTLERIMRNRVARGRRISEMCVSITP